jgi:hypothetical protein
MSKERQKVNQQELDRLAGYLDFLKTMVDIEKKVLREDAYHGLLSHTVEDVIIECRDIAARLLYAGLDETETT